MTTVDERGCNISGATPASLEAYEQALATYQSWRSGADAELKVSVREAPGFVMAHVLRAWLRVSSRDQQSVRSARPMLELAEALPANERERLHLAAIASALADDYEGARERLGEVLHLYPRELLALVVAHAFDYLIGDPDRMRDRIEAVLPAWSPEAPGYHDAGARWAELAAAWSPHIDDAFCSFNDLHAMLAFVGARDWERAHRLEHALTRSYSLPTRHGETTRQLGLPAARALIAFGSGDDTLAVSLLGSLSEQAYRFGGSHAQRDVLHLTLLDAVEHIRRPGRRARVEQLVGVMA